ncbi:hypothetical protein H310_03681 [Aphanomyces invadans]|nr:hypothetical protein H310_03681 [Aphanomyces invadans]ETW06087.1 hypothetical protein H310_03681 [Aphanomyces invadans]|eukprot:XP_008865864.1 hypothetical protein H310_03681 [Aphanomyces invadans]
MWCYWFRGDAVNQIGPFRFLRSSDVNDTTSRNLLGRGRTVMDHLIRIATTNHFATSLDHIAAMAPSDFMGVFDKSFEIFVRKTPDGMLTRDGFESVRWEQVVFTTYGAVYDLITTVKKK